jgi:hypothetical protein
MLSASNIINTKGTIVNDCKHQTGFQTESYSLSGAGFAYIVRCQSCHAVVGVTIKDYGTEIREIQNKLSRIEAMVMSPR